MRHESAFEYEFYSVIKDIGIWCCVLNIVLTWYLWKTHQVWKCYNFQSNNMWSQRVLYSMSGRLHTQINSISKNSSFKKSCMTNVIKYLFTEFYSNNMKYKNVEPWTGFFLKHCDYCCWCLNCCYNQSRRQLTVLWMVFFCLIFLTIIIIKI